MPTAADVQAVPCLLGGSASLRVTDAVAPGSHATLYMRTEAVHPYSGHDGS